MFMNINILMNQQSEIQIVEKNSFCSVFGFQADSGDRMFDQTEPGLRMNIMFISDVNVIMVHVRFTTD